MNESPPPALVDLLAELRLALPAEVQNMARRARRLAGGLPLFEQVWVDALAQARVLTFYQAAEINAGRGRRLALGPLVLCEPLEDLGYARLFRARRREDGRMMRVCVTTPERGQAAEWDDLLARHVRKQIRADHGSIAAVEEFGQCEERYWIACAHRNARPVAEWLRERGRMPAPAVGELAIQMAAALAVCHWAKIPHGDISARQVLIDTRGQLVLPMPGVKPILRPGEGFASASLAPEAYDYLAPECIAEGAQASLAGDMYACGALWWHLLTGRPPIAGASALAKMRGTLTARIPPLGPIAPDADPRFVKAIEQCLARDRCRRPQSFEELATMLGPSAPRRVLKLARYALFPGRARRIKQSVTSRVRRFTRRLALATAAATLLLAVGTWPYWGNPWLHARREAWRDRHSAWIAKSAPAPSATAKAPQPAPPRGPEHSPPAKPVATALVDPQLKPATYASPLELEVIEIGAHVRAGELKLRQGVTVRPRSGRARVEVGDEGWTVAAEDVTLENIDFVEPAGTAAAAMLRCDVARIRFENCSWQLAAGERAAIHWQPAAASEGSGTSAESSGNKIGPAELTLSRCLFRGVSAAALVGSAGSLAIDVRNTLHLGPGPLIRLEAAPRAGEQVVLAASQFTLREGRALVQCPVRAAAGDYGSLAIRAESCALAPKPTGGLVVFSGDEDPAELLAALRWLGQGSVVTQDAPLAIWLASDGRRQVASEDSVQVAGLVRSQLGFAGPSEQGAKASRVVRWQVPLQSADPPGILELKLPAE